MHQPGAVCALSWYMTKIASHKNSLSYARMSTRRWFAMRTYARLMCTVTRTRKSPESAQLCMDVVAPLVRGCHIFVSCSACACVHVRVREPSVPVLLGDERVRMPQKCDIHKPRARAHLRTLGQTRKNLAVHMTQHRLCARHVHAKNVTSTNRVRVRIRAYLTKKYTDMPQHLARQPLRTYVRYAHCHTIQKKCAAYFYFK